MKTLNAKTWTCATAMLFIVGSGLTQAKDEVSPNVSPADFESQLKRDNSLLPKGGQLQMSYADVVERVLPSVVTIFSSAPMEVPDAQDIPPNLRPYFYRFFGIPDDEVDQFEDNPNPRRRVPREAPRQRGVGSGVIISADGYILTNNHVIEESDKIEVAVDGTGTTKTYEAKVIGTDPLSDVALIKIPAKGLTPAVIGNSTQLRVGDIVLAAGAPMELNLSVTQGIVSALGRSGVGILDRGRMGGYEDFIQTDASINPGNSGGPLVDAMGRLVGINTAILSRSGMNAGIGFAIPINMALNIVEDLLDDGAVQRGYLGVQIRDLQSEDLEIFKLDDRAGSLVSTVVGGSPAEQGGIQVGDIVVGVNGAKVENTAKLRNIVGAIKPNTKVPVEVLRDGRAMSLEITLGTLDQDAIAAAGSGGGPKAASPSGIVAVVDGVKAQSVNAELREKFGIPDDVSGVVVVEVDRESTAAAMGIQEGDVITQVDKEDVSNAKDAKKLADQAEKTVLLRVYRDGDTMLFMVGKS
mgnify:CR=1 FL=1